MGWIIGILLLALAALLAFLNMDAVTGLDLGFTQMDVPLWGIIAGAVLLGMVVAWLMSLSQSAKHREKLKEKDDKLKDQEDKIRAKEISRQEVVDQTRQESESELVKKNAEIEGLKKQITSLENQLNSHISDNRLVTNDIDADEPHVETTRTEKRKTRSSSGTKE